VSIIQKALDRAGLTLIGDVFPKGMRTQKHQKLFMSCLRASEAELIDMAMTARREGNEALKLAFEKNEEAEIYRAARAYDRLRRGLEAIDALTVGDRNKLLELVAPSTEVAGTVERPQISNGTARQKEREAQMAALKEKLAELEAQEAEA
jgi:hypothetical protein